MNDNTMTDRRIVLKRCAMGMYYDGIHNLCHPMIIVKNIYET